MEDGSPEWPEPPPEISLDLGVPVQTNRQLASPSSRRPCHKVSELNEIVTPAIYTL